MTSSEMFWPDAEANVGRVNLRTALASLRRQVEPPDVPAGSVLITDNNTVRLNPEAFTSDVADFDRLLRGNTAETVSILPLLEAVDLYRGDLLPGYYDEWIVPERARSAEAFYGALHRIVAAVERSGDLYRALDYALRAVGIDPLREEGHGALIRLYMATDQPAAAVRQYRVLERLLRRELDIAPSPSIRALVGVPREDLAFSPVLLSAAGEVSPASERRLPPLPLFAPAACRLPMPLTRFFGREEELARLKTLLSPVHRRRPEEQVTPPRMTLITLTGPGGSGKTRLALEAARHGADLFDNAVYFAPLADVDDVALLPDKILMALGLPRSAESDPLAQAAAALRVRPSLLVLDNFEQLVGSGMETIEALCRLPGLICLVTSRQRLGIEGEREFPVRPLPTPSQSRTPAGLTEFPSVQLFTDRAQMVRPDFQITAHNAAAVGRLCDLLEGLPLALELAATWAAVLTPAQMLEQVENRFTFLVSRSKGRPLRHRTLYAAIDSSYSLLTPPLQRLFVRLSVFRGGWTWEEAQRICADPEALPNLALLREHSLVVATESGETMRFGMLETLREFAAAQLTPTEQADLTLLHAHYFLALVEEAEPSLATADQAHWLERLEAEHDNLRAALSWARSAAGDVQTLFALVCALSRFWFLRGYFQEGRKRLEEALACSVPSVPTPLRARALLESGLLAQFHGDLHAAYDYAQQSLSLYEALEDPEGVVRAYNRLGNITSLQGDYEAASAYQEAVLQFWRQRGIKKEIASALNNLGNTANIRGSYATASVHLDEGLILARELKDTSVTAIIVGNLGLTALYKSDPAAALLLFEESFALRQQIGNRQAAAGSKANLAMAAFELGDLRKAMRLNTEALTVQIELGDKVGIAYAFEACMLFAAANGDYGKAARLGGAAEALREDLRSPLTLSYFRSLSERAVESIRTNLSAETMRTNWRAGRTMTLAQTVAMALEQRKGFPLSFSIQ